MQDGDGGRGGAHCVDGGGRRRRHHQIISHSGNPTFLQFLQFLGPSLLRSFHPSHSRWYVRSISYPALRSNPSDPTYSKAAAAAMPCFPCPLLSLRYYSDSIPAWNKLNRPAGSAGDEPNFCRIFRHSDSMSSHMNSMNFFTSCRLSTHRSLRGARKTQEFDALVVQTRYIFMRCIPSTERWRASQFDSPRHAMKMSMSISLAPSCSVCPQKSSSSQTGGRGSRCACRSRTGCREGCCPLVQLRFSMASFGVSGKKLISLVTYSRSLTVTSLHFTALKIFHQN